MDIFPIKLNDFLNIITKDHSISSWRINSGAIGLVLSIRFDSHDACMPCPSDKYYRSKPPSARHRDMDRQQQWVQQKSNISLTVDSGYEDHSKIMHKYESTPQPCSKYTFGDDKNNTSMYECSTHDIDSATNHNVHHLPHVQAAHSESHNVPKAGLDTEEDMVQHKLIEADIPTIRPLLVTAGVQTTNVKTKNRKVTAFPECYDEHTQTKHVKFYDTQTQTHQHGVDFGCTTELINMSHSVQQTDTCYTENRHMQTFSSVKHKGTQYKVQKTRVPEPKPAADVVECGDVHKMYGDDREGCIEPIHHMTEEEILMDKRLDEIIERLSVLDNWEERVGFVS